MKEIVVGIDIGGTMVKIAFINGEGEILNKWEIPTNTNDNGITIVDDICTSIMKMAKELNVDLKNMKGAGVGAPGFIDYENGIVASAPNLGWKDYPLRDEMQKLLNMPIKIENDANLAALGEMWLGAGKSSKNIVAVTLGTGVGGGVIVDGEVVHGINGMGGEIGHMFSEDNNIKCGCGKKGCLETIASATGLVREANKMIDYYSDSTSLYDIKKKKRKLTAQDVLNEAKKGDEESEWVVENAMKHLGIAISHMIHMNNPEVIVIGGGVSKAGEYLLKLIKKQVKTYTLPRAYKTLDIKLATLGNDAGIIGAAYLVTKM